MNRLTMNTQQLSVDDGGGLYVDGFSDVKTWTDLTALAQKQHTAYKRESGLQEEMDPPSHCDG